LDAASALYATLWQARNIAAARCLVAAPRLESAIPFSKVHHPLRLSKSFLPVMKESPSDAQIVSHKLMLRAGLVRQTAAGIYAWLPAGLRVLRNIEQIVREEQDKAGAVEMLMPTMQSADLWRQSGRYDAYGPEMLRITDRHKREMLFGPTNEEMITALFRDDVKSYRDLPRTLYHVQWKFRDEVRPRFGVMRGREFLMKDAYSFDLDESGARNSYYTQLLAYLRTFQRLGIRAVPMKAASGPIGGDLSHEFIVLAPTGESEVFYDSAFEEFDWSAGHLDYADEAGLHGLFEQVSGTYAATDETHDEARWAEVPEGRRRTGRGIEVGHIFYFGDKYSASMGLKVSGQDGSFVTPQMGSYGIGVSRLVGAIIEASHDEQGIVWPDAVAPWKVGLVTMRGDDAASIAAADEIYAKLTHAGVDTLYDDRDERGGVKLGSMDLIGLPWQLIIGPRGLAAGTVELKNRRSGEKQELSIADALARLTA
jgi:prolyl-tRNA synthetase